MTQLVWNPEWIRPYESPWSVFEKFCFANVIKRTEFLKQYGVDDVRKIKNNVIGEYLRDLNSLKGFEAEALNQALSFNLKEHVIQLQSIIKTHLPSDHFNWFRTNLAWCEQCLHTGYHSMLHQFVMLHHCPIHMTPLIDQCPECKKNIPYLLSDKQLSDPFTCKCGNCLSNLSERWKSWGSAPTIINCELTKKWFELSSKKMEGMSHIFIPEYALTNSNVFAYLIHAIDETFILHDVDIAVNQTSFNPKYHSWRIDGFNFPKFNTDKSSPMNSRLLINRFKQYENRDFYRFMYENSRHVFRSIDKYVRVTTLKDHKLCVERFQNFLKEENKPFPRICPHAYAYVLWKQSILGYEKFYNGMGAYKVSELESFQLIDKYFIDKYKYLLRSFLENSFNFTAEKPFELKWLVQKIAAAYIMSSLRAYDHISENGAKQRKAPSSKTYDLLVRDFIPFIIIRHPKDLASAEKITFFEFYRHQRKFKSNPDHDYPYQKHEKKIDRSIEISHTPIAYSMRYYGSSYPDNYSDEMKKLNRELLDLCAPTKYWNGRS